MEPEKLSIRDLSKNSGFFEKIRWDVTPKLLFKPRAGLSVTPLHNVDGFMFYVDVIHKNPALMIMRNRGAISSTVGYVSDAPEDLLREAMNCVTEECIAGMYPITGKIQDWIKKELGLS